MSTASLLMCRCYRAAAPPAARCARTFRVPRSSRPGPGQYRNRRRILAGERAHPRAPFAPRSGGRVGERVRLSPFTQARAPGGTWAGMIHEQNHRERERRSGWPVISSAGSSGRERSALAARSPEEAKASRTEIENGGTACGNQARGHTRNASSDHAAEPDVVPARRFYTVTEAALLLRLSAPTIYREIRAGRFPAIRVRGRYVIPAKALDAMEQAALEEAPGG